MARVRSAGKSSKGGLSPEIKSIALITVVGIAAVFWWKSRGAGEEDKKPEDGQGANAAAVAYSLPQPSHGPEDASVVLVKFTDFQ
ncbi:MAG: hypothetical protein ACI9WU_002251 [Myxococcota bacterium]|jgi:hypothetical protein